MPPPPLKCNLCERALALHCPTTNTTCDWLVCGNTACTAYIYDLHRGLLRYRDGHVEGWADEDAAGDGRPATPDA